MVEVMIFVYLWDMAIVQKNTRRIQKNTRTPEEYRNHNHDHSYCCNGTRACDMDRLAMATVGTWVGVCLLA